MKKRILIADDNPILRKTLRHLLESDGWTVVGEAANGKEAVEKAGELKPDLVVIDLAMPVMNGIEAVREMRRLWSSLPLVMFTSFNDDSLSALATSVGANAVIDKADPTILVALIHSLFASAA